MSYRTVARPPSGVAAQPRAAVLQKAGRRGFSLVEVMIVLVIIGLLAGVVTVNARAYVMKARQHTARQEIATIAKALSTYYTTYARYPTNEEGLGALTKPTDKIPEPLLDGEPIDPWSHPYQYNSPGSKWPFEVISYGADGKPGGGGADADISSDNLKE
jgi:general secretion pathway protein G